MSTDEESITGSNDSVLAGSGKFVPPPKEEWVEQFGDTLYRMVIVKVRNAELAEDLVQDTFVAGMKSLNLFKGESPFVGWLRQILNNKVVDHYRRVAKERKFTAASEQIQSEPATGMSFLGLWNVYVPNWGKNPEKTLNDEQFLGVLRECIEKLPSLQRTVFLLKFMKEVEHEEICKVVGISPSNSWVIVHRARLALRCCIEKNWVKKK